MTDKKHTDTHLVHDGSHPEDHYGLINPPVYHASTVSYPTVAALKEARANPEDNFIYGRRGTPTSFALAEAIANLEGGYRTIPVNSGLSAICTAMLAFVEAGDHVLVCDSAYGPTRNLSEKFLRRFGVETSYYDPLIGADIKEHFRPNTKTIYVESPGSHSFEVQDIPALCDAAHKAGVKVVMDNTWSAGYFFKPFEHGVDVSVQAATKYYVGHSDAMLGAVTCSRETFEQVRESSRVLGYHAAPDDAYLGLRGMRTLPVRMKRHEQNAVKVADWLAGQPQVKTLLHPAFASCPGHEFWKRDFTGSSGLFSVLLHECSDDAVAALIDNTELFALGGSWGGYESLIFRTDLTRTVTDWDLKTPCIRFHIGLEDPDDLIEDLKVGLDYFTKAN
jgi:cystathionine beta-lyase